MHVYGLGITGFKCGEYENPADFFLDVLIMCEKAAVEEKEEIQRM